MCSPACLGLRGGDEGGLSAGCRIRYMIFQSAPCHCEAHLVIARRTFVIARA